MNLYLIYLTLKILFTRIDGGVFPSTRSKIIPAHRISWTYDTSSENGIENWAHDYPKCNGSHQSPINIDTHRLYRNLGLKLRLSGFSGKIYHAFIENNGHTVQVGLLDRESKPTLTGSAVNNKVYLFEQIHFHWGNDSERGSEHSVDSVFYPLEMHVVMFNSDYGKFDDSLTAEDGIVVLAVFFKHSDHINKSLQTLIESIKSVPIYGDVADLPAIDFGQMLPRNLRNFYKYKGSLTTPPCSEVVTWLVLAQPVEIGQEQEEAFRHERSNVISPKTGDFSYLEDNYRPQIPLNGRKVEASFRSVW